MQPRFRFAAACAAPLVAEFVNAAYHGAEAELGWTPETHLHSGPRTREADVRAHVADPDSKLLLCETDDGLVGCALIEHHDGEGHLGMFAVRPRLQGAGLGKAILTEAERLATALWRCRALTMTVVSAQAQLIAYYERRGYLRTGQRIPFPFEEAPGALRFDYDLVVVRKTLSA
jgi:ribosomal protein S18 acetylase RimI-like enzyme